MTTRAEDARLRDVAGAWCIGPGLLPSHSFEMQEGLLHEICHALALGLRPSRRASDKVSDTFERVNERSKMMGLTMEAHVFAIQQRATTMLRWQKKARLKAVIKTTWECGYSGQPCSFNDFERLIRLFYIQKQTKMLAVAAAAQILRLARTRPRRR